MSCVKYRDLELCTTCRLGGLIRCPSLGTPLPLAEAEKTVVVKRTSFWPVAWPPKAKP